MLVVVSRQNNETRIFPVPRLNIMACRRIFQLFSAEIGNICTWKLNLNVVQILAGFFLIAQIGSMFFLEYPFANCFRQDIEMSSETFLLLHQMFEASMREKYDIYTHYTM